MTRKDIIELADSIKQYNRNAFPAGTNTVSPLEFTWTQIIWLADFCAAHNPRFNRQRWLAYIQGKVGRGGARTDRDPESYDVGAMNDTRFGGTLDETGE